MSNNKAELDVDKIIDQLLSIRDSPGKQVSFNLQIMTTYESMMMKWKGLFSVLWTVSALSAAPNY